MKKDVYIEKIKDTLTYSLADYNLQNIINRLRKDKIVSYNEEDKDIVIIKSTDKKDRRVKKSLEENESTLYYIEKVMIDKPYRYSIYFKCYDFVLNDKIKNYLNVEDLNNEHFKELEDYMIPRYFEDDSIIAFAFHKTINPYISSTDSTKDVIYTTLWIYHKESHILEHRFDMLGFKSDDFFYETTFKPQLQKLERDFGILTSEFRITPIIEYIVENNSNEVHEISKYMGLRGNSLAKLKVGNNLVMPFLGDLEIIMQSNKDLFDKNSDTQKIRDIINQYINDTKDNANYKSRLISWYKENKYYLSINIIFGYKDRSYDLLNFIDTKKYNMEMMNFAIEYIWKVSRDIANRK